jgi:hypothetical protein
MNRNDTQKIIVWKPLINGLKYIMGKAMNISVSYNDNESKWMLIKNAPGFSIGNNMYRGYNLQVLRDEKGMIVAYGVFQDPTDHYALIPIIEKLKKQDQLIS